jgi:hypothetical protein
MLETRLGAGARKDSDHARNRNQNPGTDDASQWKHPREAISISDLYEVAPTLASKGTRVMCTDEKTGMRVLERAQPTNPLRPDSTDRIELECVMGP